VLTGIPIDLVDPRTDSAPILPRSFLLVIPGGTRAFYSNSWHRKEVLQPGLYALRGGNAGFLLFGVLCIHVCVPQISFGFIVLVGDFYAK
jgi:hypothetical protein